MDFVRSHFLMNEPLTSLEYFFPRFGVPVYCKVCQIEENVFKTGQRFIRKEVTSYKIHILEGWNY